MQGQVFQVLPRAAVRPSEEAAWSELVRRYGARIAARVRRALTRFGVRPTEDLVEELAQEVYCRLLERHGRDLADCRAANENQFLAYLYRVAESAVVDRLRQARAAKRGPGRLVPLSAPASEEAARRFADPAATPEETVLASDGYRRLVGALREAARGSLASRNLGILLLSAVEGWTSREIAGALPGDLAASSVDSVLHRLRGRLRRDLADLAPA